MPESICQIKIPRKITKLKSIQPCTYEIKKRADNTAEDESKSKLGS